jgi:D-hexose-6-phosphate mutarotase
MHLSPKHSAVAHTTTHRDKPLFCCCYHCCYIFAQALLHTYLAVPDIAAVAVEGLGGLQYINQLTGESLTAQTEPITISEEVDSVYLQAVGDATLTAR